MAYFQAGAGARVPTINESLQRLPQDILEKVCHKEHLLKLTDHFSEWIKLSTYLGLTQVQQEDIENAWPRKPQRQRIEMFKKWRQTQKEKSSYRYL